MSITTAPAFPADVASVILRGTNNKTGQSIYEMRYDATRMGTVESNFQESIRFVRRQFANNERVVGAFYHDGQMGTFTMGKDAHGRSMVEFDHPSEGMWQYNDKDGKRINADGFTVERYVEVIDNLSRKWVTDYRVDRIYSPETEAHMGATAGHVLTQCVRMAGRFTPDGRDWFRDMGGAELRDKLFRRTQNGMGDPTLDWMELWSMLTAYTIEYREELETGQYTPADYQLLVDKCREVLNREYFALIKFPNGPGPLEYFYGNELFNGWGERALARIWCDEPLEAANMLLTMAKRPNRNYSLRLINAQGQLVVEEK